MHRRRFTPDEEKAGLSDGCRYQFRTLGFECEAHLARGDRPVKQESRKAGKQESRKGTLLLLRFDLQFNPGKRAKPSRLTEIDAEIGAIDLCRRVGAADFAQQYRMHDALE